MIELLNMDCMDYLAGLPDKAFDLKRSDNFRNRGDVSEIAFPKSNNRDAKLFHVGILGHIQCHTLSLPMVWRWVSIFFAMPIITIKLYDDIFGRDEGVNRKFPADNMLANKINASRIKDGVTKLFKPVRFLPFVLIRPHLERMRLKALALVSAIYRTILLGGEHGRTNKSRIANLTNQCDFVPSLMLVGAGDAACQRASGPVGWGIKRRTTNHTVFMEACLVAPRLAVFVITRWRAKFHLFRAGFFNGNTTPHTQEFSNRIFHGPMVAQTQKPVAFNEWRFEAHKAQATLFQPDDYAPQQVGLAL